MKTLYFGGKILTMASLLVSDALVEENGIILDVGTEGEMRKKYSGFNEVSLNGGFMMPGFIDAHSHFIRAAMSFTQVNLDGVSSEKEIRNRIFDFIKENRIKPGSFINACSYDNNLMPSYKNPSLEALDSFCPGYPLIIHHKSGHMGLMNSLAMDKFGIDSKTKAPEGGKIGRENGKLTGYFEENAYFAYLGKTPVPDLNTIIDSVEKAQRLYASYGITTVHEGMTSREMVSLYVLLSKMNLPEQSVRLYLDRNAFSAGRNAVSSLPGDKIKVCGIKIFLDGSPQGRTAWLRKPYEGEDSYCGYGTHSDDEVISAFIEAAENKTQLIAHANGDGAVEQFLRCLAEAEKTHPELKKLKPVIIHGQLMGRDQIERAKELGAMVSFFVAHTLHWGDTHIRNLGYERASLISPACSALKAGLPFTFHQDTPVILPDMTETVYCAVNRKTAKGVSLSREECIPVYNALEAVTKNCAYQYSEEDKYGTLEKGKAADLVILDKDILEVPPEEIRSVRVLKTIKGGKTIYEA